MAGAVVLLVAVGAFTMASLRAPEATWFDPAGAWSLLVSVALLRQGVGGSSSWVSVLVALPLVWIALFGRLRQLVVTAVLAGLVYALPAAVAGPPDYVESDWRRGLSWMLFGLLAAPAISHVVWRLRDRETDLRASVDRSNAMQQATRLAAVVSTDSDGVIVDYNGGAERLFGFTLEQVLSRRLNLVDLYLPEELDDLAEDAGCATGLDALRKLALTEADSRIWSHRRSDNTRIFARSVLTQLSSRSGEPAGLLMMAIDATSAITSRHELVAARDESDRLFEDSPQAIAVVDASSGELVRVNEAFALLFDRPKADLVGSRLGQLSPDSAETVEAHLRALRVQPHGRAASNWTFTRHGRTRQVVLTSTLLGHASPDSNDSGPREPALQQSGQSRSQASQAAQALITMTDISVRHEYEQQLSYLADYDSLTGLANRRLLYRELNGYLVSGPMNDAQTMNQPRGDSSPGGEAGKETGGHGSRGSADTGKTGGSLLVIDLDHFKDVNDNLGHAAGDDLVVRIAERMQQCVRRDDLVARLGGDEFAVLLTTGGCAGAQRVASLIVTTIRDYAATLDGPRRHVTASVGVVVINDHQTSAEELLADADRAMYQAKEAGRDQYVILGQQPRPGGNSASSSSRFAWRARLATAIENNQLELHLQPIRSVATGRINGAEVLLRLQDTDQLVYPNEFLPVAERSDLIVDLDIWVIGRAVEILTELQESRPGFRLEMNLSGRSIGDPRVESALRDALTRSGCDPHGLILEITETAAIANLDTARQFAERVMSMGCRFALDDFGAGYGSFYYLKHLVFDYIKIDGEFISRITRDDQDKIFVRSIVRLARDLGKKTVAEYVEDDETYNLIAAEGVDYAQGYGVGRPVPLRAFVARHMGEQRIPL